MTFDICGNCDIPGLIPEGKTSDDCLVCDGIGWIGENDDGTMFIGNLEQCEEFLTFIRSRRDMKGE